MLRSLVVQDLALLERAELELGAGLTLLTGETGSGKSLLVDALGLALGGRAQSGLVRAGAERAQVQASFESNGRPLEVQRTVGPRGSASRDGEPIAIADLAALGRSLVAVHGQHDQQALVEPGAQAALLDALAGAGAGRERVAVLHEAWVRAAARHRALADARARGAEQRDFDLWRLRQLQSVDPQPGEDERLAVERSVLRHATQLLALAGLAGERLDTDGVAEAAGAIAQAAQLDDRLGALAGRLGAVVEELRDGARELRGYGEALDADPGRLEEVESRLAALDEVKRRHGGTLDAVLAERDRLLAVLGGDGDPDQELAAATATELGAADELRIAASELTRARTAGAGRFAAGVGRELAGLGLADARLEVRLVSREEIGVDGAETVEVWFTANAGEAPAPLQRVASGGELSRVMLAIEAATAEVSGTPTLVFDEVDAGIGGATALEVGRRLQRLARHRQVLVVTHLAQVAAFADRHLVVDKVQAGGRTAVRVTDLRTAAERGPELARMMSGAVTEKALARAEELLDSARPPEPLAGPARSTGRSAAGGAHAASTRPRHRPPARQPVRTPA